jgi:hypothetical protein
MIFSLLNYFESVWFDIPVSYGEVVSSRNMSTHSHSPVYANNTDVTEINIPAANVTAWKPPSANNLDSLVCSVNSTLILFALPFKTGSIFNAFRIKYLGAAGNNGVALTIYVRDESDNSSNWTNIHSKGFLNATIITLETEEFANIILQAGYSYALVVTALCASSAVSLYSVGIRVMRAS